MKTLNPRSSSHSLRRLDLRLASALVAAALCSGVAVHTEEGDDKPATAGPLADRTDSQEARSSAPVAALPEELNSTNRPPAEALSPLVSAVVKMADAGVSGTVIQAFIECAPSVPQLTQTDVIALKQHEVADEIVTGLLKRSARERAQDAQRKTDAVARVLAARQARSGGMDPESYEYFQYYYLQPRAMASAHRRLSPYVRPWGFRTYGPTQGYGARYRGYGRYRY